jgi:hypothetical protein
MSYELFSIFNSIRFVISTGHAGTISAQYTAAELMDKIERSNAWGMYLKISPNDRKKHCDLVSRSLVEAYVAIDEGLLNRNDMVIATFLL